MYQRPRNLREDRDLNQTAVTEVLHVSQTTYSHNESGALDIPSGALIALARFYSTRRGRMWHNSRVETAMP